MSRQFLTMVLALVSLLIPFLVIAHEDSPETVTDFDGNVYATVRIGNQVWMAENLRATHYSDGTPLENFVYNADEANAKKYGRLYRWQASIQSPSGADDLSDQVQGASPEGWHIPSEADWLELIDFLGGSDVAGGKILQTDNNPQEGGFNATLSGWFDFTGKYLGFGEKAFLRSSTAPGKMGGFARELNRQSTAFKQVFLHPKDAIAIRCIKDSPNQTNPDGS